METETIEVTVKTMDSGQQKFEVNGEVYNNKVAFVLLWNILPRDFIY